jgi:hypothetical protein
LGSRIDNIRHKEFFDGYLDGPRDQDARLSTLFRFANYFGWREAVRREVQLLRFENDKDTKSVATALNDVAAIFSTDSLDDGRGMLWAEEQRAIGELMVTERHDGSATVRGHAEFWEDYGEDFAKWMDRFGDEILTLEAADSERFRYLQWGLWAVARRLGGESGFGYEDSKWIERAGDESVGRAVDPDSQAVERLREHLRDLTE